MGAGHNEDSNKLDEVNATVSPPPLTEIERARLIRERDAGPPPAISALEHLMFKLYVGGIWLCLGACIVVYFYRAYAFPRYGYITGIFEQTSVLNCPIVPCWLRPGACEYVQLI